MCIRDRREDEHDAKARGWVDHDPREHRPRGRGRDVPGGEHRGTRIEMVTVDERFQDVFGDRGRQGTAERAANRETDPTCLQRHPCQPECCEREWERLPQQHEWPRQWELRLSEQRDDRPLPCGRSSRMPCKRAQHRDGRGGADQSARPKPRDARGGRAFHASIIGSRLAISAAPDTLLTIKYFRNISGNTSGIRAYRPPLQAGFDHQVHRGRRREPHVGEAGLAENLAQPGKAHLIAEAEPDFLRK